MKTFVINLPKDEAKRESVSRQLKTQGIEFEIVNAVYGKELTKDELEVKCDFRKMRRIGRELTRGEIGCALSHLSVYERIVKENLEFACVLEDDAIIAPAFKEIAEEGAKFIKGKKAVVLLEESPAYTAVSVRLCYCYNAVALGCGYCTHAYLVTREAAQAMLNFMRPVCRVADCWSLLVQRRVIELYGVTPTPTMVDLTFGSSITEWSGRKVYANRMDQFIQRVRHVFWRKIYEWRGE